MVFFTFIFALDKTAFVMINIRCSNCCFFCFVPKREGYTFREFPVTHGYIVLDDNLLACSAEHIKKVFEMLKRQPQKLAFTGGLESRLLKPWHVDLLREAKTNRIYFACDSDAEYEPLIVGFPGDTMEKAEKRLRKSWAAGFFPFAMHYRDEQGVVKDDWKSFTRLWARPQITHHLLKEGARV